MNVVRDKIAFILHSDELFHHYRNVWDFLGKGTFDIILNGSLEDRNVCADKASIYDIDCYHLEDLLRNKIKYQTVVSNHSMYRTYSGSSLIKALGNRQIRFMYALGKYKHNFSSWNQDYDLALCFGPWQADKLASMYDLATFQMGYPRYDDYFNKPELIGYCPPELNLDPNKKTILWLPTWLELSSVPAFVDSMSALTDEYNIIVKLHPLSAAAEPEKLELLYGRNFTKVITEVYDNLVLFRCADFVFCDYGGTAFGALYLDKPLALLNIDDAEKDSLVGEESPELLLRKDIVNYQPDEGENIRNDLKNTVLWAEQVKVRSLLRKKYFNSSYGFSAQLAALVITNVENILKQG